MRLMRGNSRSFVSKPASAERLAEPSFTSQSLFFQEDHSRTDFQTLKISTVEVQPSKDKLETEQSFLSPLTKSQFEGGKTMKGLAFVKNPEYFQKGEPLLDKPKADKKLSLNSTSMNLSYRYPEIYRHTIENNMAQRNMDLPHP